MALNILDELTATAHPLGSENILDWIFPAEMSDEYQLVIFKRKSSAVTDSEISDYQTSETVASGLTVFLAEDGQVRLYDYDCDNGSTYYYAACIQNTSSGTWYTKVTANATTGFSAAENYVDSKTVIIEAIKRVMENYSAVAGKDYQIQKSFSSARAKPPIIAVIRQGAEDAQRFTGDIIEDAQEGAKYGKIEQDNILVVWEDVSSDRRDNMTNIFRLNEITLKNYILKTTNAVDMRLRMGGDSIDERWTDVTMHAGEMYIQIIAPVYLEFNDLEKYELYDTTDIVQIDNYEFEEGIS